ncbi:MAG: 3-hydroxyacyl-CoA dehydrogenase NAD-binding domain-containing protein [Alphaproteobacteria bacterium]|nr:3-hydroxyacyl-CoA dehydrogenase NAD-binding domain-containing protein [Alphaproteobacteria bacterium]
MTREIKKVGVIGAGIMGSGIAAQLANAGVEVVLLDKFPGKAEAEIKRMQSAKPTDAFNAGLMMPENARYITPGTTDDNIDLLKDCDWIVESILAPHKIREQLYKDLEKVAKPDAIFSSNTSTIQIATMMEGQSDDFKRRFLNTHFFNPVRFMHLLEVITGPETDPEILDTFMEFSSRVMGKKPVHCKDARGFIANRIGIFAMERAHAQALGEGMRIEDVDAIMGQAFGFPRLGLFKLADEVGLPVIEHVRNDLNENLPEDDAFCKIFTGAEELKGMIADGYLGVRDPRSKGGYYRRVPGPDGKPVKEVRDLRSGEYKPFVESPYARFEKQIAKHGGFSKFFESDDKAARFAWPVMRDLMIYILDHADELAYSLQDIDDAMRAGFNWEYGPFELLDKIGVEWFTAQLQKEGVALPSLLKTAANRPFYRRADGQNQVMNFEGSYGPIQRKAGVLNLEDIKAASTPLITHNSASLWDIGDGVTALEFHATKNAIDPSMFWVINESIKLVRDNPDRYKGMVIYNDAKSFSYGANLKLMEVFMNASQNGTLKAVGAGAYLEGKLLGMIEELVYEGQSVYNALKQAPFPVVGAPKGNPQNMAFGGGCEILLHCDAIQAGPEQIFALPEAGLGVLPGWGGTTRYLERATNKPGQMKGPMPPVIETAMALANPMLSAATCAQDAKKKLWISKDDGISMDPDRVLADAKAKVLAMAPDYKPAPQPVYSLPGITGKGAIRMDVDKLYMMGGDPAKTGINHVDVKVADALSDVLTGGEVIIRADVDRHVADPLVAAKLKQIMDERGEDSIAVHPGIALTISRLLQLERDRFLDRFRDKATWKRVSYTMAKNKPLREQRPQPEPTPKEIRESVTPVSLPRRDVTGKPLEGADADRLKAMAEMTAEFYRLNEQHSTWGRIKQAPKTLASVGRVFGALRPNEP